MVESAVTFESSGWSGEGEFTQKLVETLKSVPDIRFLRVENAPATRAEADYNFISNEIYVGFGLRTRHETFRRFGILPATRPVHEPAMSIADLEQLLASMNEIGAADYSDQTMLQYLRTERIIPPYQTRGYKLVELVRIYVIRPGTDGRESAG
jgi:hypothetical protein